MSQEIFIQARPEHAGLRLDSFLTTMLSEYTRAQLNRIIKDNYVSINNQYVKPSFKLTGCESIIFKAPVKKSSNLIAQNLNIEIIYSDDHLAIINKRAGMTVHPGAGVYDNTLVNALLYYFPNIETGGTDRPGIVHRLDKNTSGLIIIALTHQAHVALTNAFKQREIEKIYSAFCYGEPEEVSFELKTGHVRHAYNRLKFFTGLAVPLSPSSPVRFAHTSFKRIKSSFGVTELEAKLFTGRTHQIRAHLADINHPLLGDKLYGGLRMLSAQAPKDLIASINQLAGQALHAQRLCFEHPVTKKVMIFEAPLPDYLARISNNLI